MPKVTASTFAFSVPSPADLSIKKSSIFFPRLMAATSHLGLAPLPAQVSPERLLYFGGTFLPFKDEPIRNALPLGWPVIAANCFSGQAEACSNLVVECGRPLTAPSQPLARRARCPRSRKADPTTSQRVASLCR